MDIEQPKGNNGVENAPSSDGSNEEKNFFLAQDNQGYRREISGTLETYVQNQAMVQELVVCLFACGFGWYGPHFMREAYGGVRQREIPYQETAAGDVILDFSLNKEYIPSSDVIITSSTLINTSCWLPLVVIVVVGMTFQQEGIKSRKLSRYTTHAAVCVLLLAIGLSEFCAQMVKAYVGRLRPNFYGMCGFDLDTKQCTAPQDRQDESRQSFPSGHSSLSFNGMVVLVLFFLGRVGLNRILRESQGGISVGRKQFMAFLSVIGPLSYSFFVASSRLVDNWHHPSDVIAGSIIGTVSATVAYHLFFPPVFSPHAGIPVRSLSS